jgi:chlorite dismutase
MSTHSSSIVEPPETLEGWYQLTQVFRVDRRLGRALPSGERGTLRQRASAALTSMLATGTAAGEEDGAAGAGWSTAVELVGSAADVMLVHFRPTLDAIAAAQTVLESEPLFDYLNVDYSFLSVTEAGLYHITAQLAREAAAEGANARDPVYQERLAQRAKAEMQNPHVRRRLYPQLPPDMPYVCFYPMSKRRAVEQNWYALPLEERSRLMLAHGITGRRYAGRVVQVISGAIGLDAWEWGVTLFSGNPIEFKKLVTDMRFDEVSAKYAEFGAFYVGRIVGAEEFVGALG